MKKTLIFLLTAVVLLCSVCFAIAEGNDVKQTDGFTWRNISFLMSPDEVKKIESLEFDHEEYNEKNGHLVLHYKGEVAGVKNSTVAYTFTNKAALIEIIVGYNINAGELQAQRDYSKISSALKEKYGAPLGNTNGKTHSLVGQLLSINTGMYSLLGMVNGSLDYNEWLLESPGYYVKIDHQLLCMGSKDSRTVRHDLTYTFFAQEALEAITDDL